MRGERAVVEKNDIKILLVDDDTEYLDLEERFLRKVNPLFNPVGVESARDALERIRDDGFDIIVSDYMMPDIDGLEFLRILREEYRTDIPFIMLTGKGREEVAMKTLNLGGDRYIQKGGAPKTQFAVLAQAIEQEVRHWQREGELKRIGWLIKKEAGKRDYEPPYGDLSELNEDGLIKNSVTKESLVDLTEHFMRLLDSSTAIYEKEGDYALGIFSSGWCQYMDTRSRELCDTEDNQKALESGKWLCHESCWSAAKECMEKRKPVDIECNGGINMYAVPIDVDGDVVGVMNFGYGDPPEDEDVLKELADKYDAELGELKRLSKEYEKRPEFIIEASKNRIKTSARLLGEIIKNRKAELRAEHLNSLLKAIRNVNQVIVQGDDLKEIMKGACEALVENRSYFEVILSLLDDRSGEISPIAQAGEHTFKGDWSITLDGEGEAPTCIKKAVKSGDIEIIDTSNCGDCGFKSEEEYHMSAVVPMKRGEDVVGFLKISLEGYVEIDEEEKALLREVANDLGFARSKILAERKVEREKELFETIFDRLPLMVTIYNPKMEDFRVNEKFTEVLGWTNEDVRKMDVMETCYPDPEYREEVAEFMNRAEPDWETFRVKAKDGSIVESSWTNIKLSDERQIGIGIDLREKKKLEKELVESEERYRGIFKTTKDALIIIDAESGEIVDANPAVMNLFGYRPEGIIGKKMWDVRIFASAFDEDRFNHLLDENLHDDYKLYSLKSRCGDDKPVELIGRTYRAGLQDLLQLNIRELTAVKEREKELRMMFELLKISNEPGITDDDMLQRIVDMIPDSWQYPSITEAKLTVDDMEFITEGYKDTEWKLSSDIHVNEENIGRLEVVYLKEKPELDHGPFMQWEVKLIHGITDMLGPMIEKREMEKRNRFQADILDQVDSSVIATDMQGNITLWNKKAEEMYGWKAEEVMGKNITEVTPTMMSKAQAEEIMAELSKCNSWSGEFVVKDKDGREFWALVTDAPIFDQDGNMTGIVGVSTDVTDRKRMEKKLKEKTLFEETVATVSSRLVNFEDFDRTMDDVLEILGTFTEADRAYIFQIREEVIDNTHEWCAEGVSSQIDNLQGVPIDVTPWWMGKMERGEVINIEDVSSLPLEAKAEKEILEAQDIQSVLVFPINVKEELIGFVGLDNTRSTKEWKDMSVNILHIFSEIVSEAFERNITRERLERSEKHFRALFKDSPVSVIIHDKDTGEIIDANPTAYQSYGFSSLEELKDKDLWLEPPYSFEDVLRNIRKAAKEGLVQFEWCSKKKSGEIYWEEVSLCPVTIHGEKRVLATSIDITERKKAEIALKESERILRLYIDKSPYGIFVADLKGDYLEVNEKACEITGYSEEELLEMNILDQYDENTQQRAMDAFSNIQERGELKIQLPFIKKDGSKGYWNISAIVISDDRVIGFVDDITYRKKAEQRDDFLNSLLRHDIKNKIQTIQGYLELMEELPKLSEDCEKYIRSAMKGVRSSVDLIDKVRLLIQAEKDVVGEVGIESNIKNAVDELVEKAEEEGIEIDVRCPDESCKVKASSLLKDIFSNLIENAIKYSEGSKIRISGGSSDDEVVCYVEDDGVGIPDEQKGKIFDRGYTSDSTRGTGLGLFLVKMLLETYGGSIEVKDSELGGTMFEVHLKKA